MIEHCITLIEKKNAFRSTFILKYTWGISSTRWNIIVISPIITGASFSQHSHRKSHLRWINKFLQELIWGIVDADVGPTTSRSIKLHRIQPSSRRVSLRWSLYIVPLGIHNNFTARLCHPRVRSQHSRGHFHHHLLISIENPRRL